MKIVLPILFFIFSNDVLAQRVIKVGGFSDRYYGKIFIKNSEKLYSDGWLGVYEVETDQEVAKSACRGLQIQRDIPEWQDSLSYSDQGVIIYDDLTFDGIKDIALFNGQYGAFGGWTFDIFLGIGSTIEKEQKKKSKKKDVKIDKVQADTSWFEFSPDFTRIIKKDGIFFNKNAVRKTITLISEVQPNAYRYLLSTYEIRNNRPHLVMRQEYKTFLR